MTAIKPSIKDVLCLKKIPTVLEKSYEMEAFVMGHHMYKEMWLSFVGEKLDTAMQPIILTMTLNLFELWSYSNYGDSNYRELTVIFIIKYCVEISLIFFGVAK